MPSSQARVVGGCKRIELLQSGLCYVISMATLPKKTKPQTPQQRMASRRERLRAQGLRPVQHWVPDLRDPKVLAEIRREMELIAQHPENDAIDAWNEAAYDWSAWK